MVYKELLVIAIVSVAFASTFCINVLNPCVCHNYMCIYYIFLAYLILFLYLSTVCIVNLILYNTDYPN